MHFKHLKIKFYNFPIKIPQINFCYFYVYLSNKPNQQPWIFSANLVSSIKCGATKWWFLELLVYFILISRNLYKIIWVFTKQNWWNQLNVSIIFVFSSLQQLPFDSFHHTSRSQYYFSRSCSMVHQIVTIPTYLDYLLLKRRFIKTN